MKGEHFFASAQRSWEEPPDEPDYPVPPLPPEGVCPYCRQPLIVVEHVTACPSALTLDPCDYDSFFTEEENRKRFQDEPSGRIAGVEVGE